MRSRTWTARLVVLVAALTVVTVPAPATAASVSGIVVAVESDRIVIADVGPWQIERGETKITRRTVALTPSTRVVRVQRIDGPDGHGWPGGFSESTAATVQALKSGDFVAVEVMDSGGKLMATKLTIVDVKS